MYVLLAVSALVAALLIWGVGIEPRFFEVKEETAFITDLPAEWEGKKIAVIADMQVGMWLNNTDTIEDVAAEVAEKRPAAVLIPGDFLYHPTDKDNELEEIYSEAEEDRDDILGEIEKMSALLRPLIEAGIPVYAVLGNHDYAMETPDAVKLDWVANETAAALGRRGVKVLENEAARISLTGEPSSEPLYVVGIGSHYAGKSNPEAAISGVPENAPRVVFMHNPDSFAGLPPHSAPLAVAAHTHGGQIRLPLTPNWSWLDYKVKGDALADGWIEDFGQAGNRLYVNRGIGFSVLPIRFNCMPELTMFTLRRAP